MIFIHLSLVAHALEDPIHYSIEFDGSHLMCGIENQSKQKIVLPNFDTCRTPSICLVYQTGEFITDHFPSAPRNPNFGSWMEKKLTPNSKSENKNCIAISPKLVPVRFNFNRDGKYYLTCFRKVLQKHGFRIIRSNILVLSAKDGDLLLGQQIRENEVPESIMKAFSKKRDQIFQAEIDWKKH